MEAMALDVTTNDAAALTDSDLDELASMEEAFSAGQLSKAKEDWVLVTMARFGGALPLAVAAYNAGPNRIDEWLGTFGDPRGVDVPMLDWMEMIPFTETRNYVQRVIENMPIYRARDPALAALEHPMARWLRAGNG